MYKLKKYSLQDHFLYSLKWLNFNIPVTKLNFWKQNKSIYAL